MAVELLAGERKENESDKAVIACNDYLLMGHGRSLDKLCERYLNATDTPLTRRIKTLKDWSVAHNWVERAQAYENAIMANQSAKIERLRTEGLAADHERIRELDKIYQALDREFGGGTGLWYKDKKISAKGDVVTVDVFNKPLIDSMRGVLDDIAKEVGGRKQKSEVSGPGGGPIEYKDANDTASRILGKLGELAARVGTQTTIDGNSADFTGSAGT